MRKAAGSTQGGSEARVFRGLKKVCPSLDPAGPVRLADELGFDRSSSMGSSAADSDCHSEARAGRGLDPDIVEPDLAADLLLGWNAGGQLKTKQLGLAALLIWHAKQCLEISPIERTVDALRFGELFLGAPLYTLGSTEDHGRFSDPPRALAQSVDKRPAAVGALVTCRNGTRVL